jgi:hypothetical protein
VDGKLQGVARWLVEAESWLSSRAFHKSAAVGPSSSLLLQSALMQLHVMRRLAECFLVHRFSASQQHVVVTAFGQTQPHYTAAAASVSLCASL